MKLYDYFEYEAVAEYPDTDCTTRCEPIIGWKHGDPYPDEECLRVFWTIYGHLPSGGVRALMDFDDYDDFLKHAEFFKELFWSGVNDE